MKSPNLAPVRLDKQEVDDLLFTFSPKTYVEHVEKRPLYRWQGDVLDDTSQFIVVDGSRQGGKSTIIAKPAAHSARFFPGSLTLIIAAREDQAVEDMRKVKTFISFDKDYPKIIRSSDSLIELANGSRIMAITATEESARGYSEYEQGPRLIILDESARIPEVVFTACVLPMLTGNPDAIILVVSTPRGRTGFFWDSMQDKTFSRYHIRAPWDVIDLDWRLVPAAPEAEWRKACAAKGIKGYYSPRDYNLDLQKFFLRKMGPLLYRQEKLGEFVEPEDQVFSYDEIERLFHPEIPAKPLEMDKINLAQSVKPIYFKDED